MLFRSGGFFTMEPPGKPSAFPVFTVAVPTAWNTFLQLGRLLSPDSSLWPSSSPQQMWLQPTVFFPLRVPDPKFLSCHLQDTQHSMSTFPGCHGVRSRDCARGEARKGRSSSLVTAEPGRQENATRAAQTPGTCSSPTSRPWSPQHGCRLQM